MEISFISAFSASKAGFLQENCWRVKLEPEVCRYHYDARRKIESIEQK